MAACGHMNHACDRPLCQAQSRPRALTSNHVPTLALRIPYSVRNCRTPSAFRTTTTTARPCRARPDPATRTQPFHSSSADHGMPGCPILDGSHTCRLTFRRSLSAPTPGCLQPPNFNSLPTLGHRQAPGGREGHSKRLHELGDNGTIATSDSLLEHETDCPCRCFLRVGFTVVAPVQSPSQN